MLSEFFRSFKKSLKIRKLTKKYVGLQISSATNVFEALVTDRSEEKNKIIDEIVDLAFNEPNNQYPIKKFKINRKKLADTISDLEKFGCGQYAKGHYVAISSILYAQTLEFIFYKKRNTRPEKEVMAFELINYFEENNTGNLVDIAYD